MVPTSGGIPASRVVPTSVFSSTSRVPASEDVPISGDDPTSGNNPNSGEVQASIMTSFIRPTEIYNYSCIFDYFILLVIFIVVRFDCDINFI